VIRRLIVAATIVLGTTGFVFAGTADAAQNVLCVWNNTPTHLGPCLAI
jgi:hypothetical protein